MFSDHGYFGTTLRNLLPPHSNWPLFWTWKIDKRPRSSTWYFERFFKSRIPAEQKCSSWEGQITHKCAHRPLITENFILKWSKSSIFTLRTMCSKIWNHLPRTFRAVSRKCILNFKLNQTFTCDSFSFLFTAVFWIVSRLFLC